MTQVRREQSFVMIKPDGVQRALIGDIIHRFERTGLKLAALSFGMLDEKKCWEHYNKDEQWFMEKGTRIVAGRKEAGLPIEKEAIDYGRDIIQQLVVFMTSGPVVKMVWEGNEAVGVVKKIVGGTEPLTSDVGTIRGDYTVDSYDLSGIDGRAVRNLIHCSDAPEEAQREIGIWFDQKDIMSYRLVEEQILYDVNLDGILE